MQRRAQKPITIRSDRAAARLALLTRHGRSQAAVIEEALDLLPLVEVPDDMSPDDAAQYARLRQLIDMIPPGAMLSMPQFDALEYDENGDLR